LFPLLCFFVEDGVVHGTIAPVDVENVVIVAVDVAAIDTEYDDVVVPAAHVVRPVFVVPAVVAFPIDDMDYLVYTSTVVVVDDNATIFHLIVFLHDKSPVEY